MRRAISFYTKGRDELKVGANPIKIENIIINRYRLQPETRLHEEGIASNRITERYGESHIWGVLTTRQAEKEVCAGRVLYY
jgi:hypothetical protein